MVYIASVTVQVVEERIFCIVVAGGIHPVRTIQVVNFISCVRRIMFTLIDIGCRITADTGCELGIQSDSKKGGNL